MKWGHFQIWVYVEESSYWSGLCIIIREHSYFTNERRADTTELLPLYSLNCVCMLFRNMNNLQCNIDLGGPKQLWVNVARISIHGSRLVLWRNRSIVVNVMNQLQLNNHSSFDARPITYRHIQNSSFEHNLYINNYPIVCYVPEY